MDVPGDQLSRTGSQQVSTAPVPVQRAPRRRRPSGEAPPLPRKLQTSGVRWLAAVVAVVALTAVVFGGGMRGLAVSVTVADDAVVRWFAGLDVPGLVGFWRLLAAIGSWWVLNPLLYGLILALLVLRRWRHLIVFLIVSNLLVVIVELVAMLGRRPRPFGVEIKAAWGGWALPPHQVTFLAGLLVAVLYTMVPEGRWRNVGKAAAAVLVALLAVGRIALGAEAPTDVIVGAVLGVTVPLLAFRLFTPNEIFPVVYRRGRSAHLDVGGARGQAIRRALTEQLGLVVQSVKPFGLAGSAGSTPLRITVAGEDGGPPRILFAKLYARNHLRADRWYKLGRELLYGRLEDEKPFNTVQRLVQQEDYALRLCRDAGLPSAAPYGFVELTPDWEYMLVTEFFDGAVELGEAECDERIIDDGLGIVRKLWHAGLAHRDIKPANLLVRDGRVLLIDVAFVETRPSPWRQAVDLANMMLCLALRSTPGMVYERALRQFTVEEITEAFAAARGLALPSQLRRMIRAQGRDLHAEFVKLLPVRPQPIRIQRWSLRRVGLMALVAALVALVVGISVSSLLNNDAANKTSLGIARLDCDRFETLWLVAQSVPSASQLPCVPEELPGWMVSGVAVNNGRSVITLDQDRAGTAAVVMELTATCDTGDAVESPSQVARGQRFESPDQVGGGFDATWYERFEGGCVTYRLHSQRDPIGRFATEARVLLSFTSRQHLRDELERRSGGRLHLDPGTTS
ncbi:MAG TPA: phosphatase PAP2 family protein [Actinomycetota bacterium]|nr:phosphatase PAP2 family protein [Actinomycetota bacterium]